MTLVKFAHRPYRFFNKLENDPFLDLPVAFKCTPSDKWNNSIPVNILEKEEGYQLEIIAPGNDKKDFDIKVEQDVLTISLLKKDTPGEQLKYVRREYGYPSFKKSFSLEGKINEEEIVAEYVNGVLTINLPKKKIVKETTKEINIK